MNKPILTKPTQELWQNDDEDLSKLLTHLDNKVLNVKSEWLFVNKHTLEEVSYTDVLKQLLTKFPRKEYVDIVIKNFFELPDLMNTLKKDIETILIRFISTTQEKNNFLKASLEYMDYVEQENLLMQRKVNLWKKSIDEYETTKPKKEVIENNLTDAEDEIEDNEEYIDNRSDPILSETIKETENEYIESDDEEDLMNKY